VADAGRIASIVCFAPDRPRQGTVPVFAVVSQAGLTSLSTKRPDDSNAHVACDGENAYLTASDGSLTAIKCRAR
jgi:hypothetical protein